MRRIAYAITIVLVLMIGGTFTAEAQVSLAGVTWNNNGSCSVTSFTSGISGLINYTYRMNYSCSGRFAGKVRAQIYFDPNYGKVSLVDQSFGRVTQDASEVYTSVPRQICKIDGVSGIEFCDLSGTVTVAPSILSCLIDKKSRQKYCPTWTDVGAFDAVTGSAALATASSVNPVGAPTTVGGSFIGVPAKGNLASTIAPSVKCGTPIAEIFWETTMGGTCPGGFCFSGAKSHRVVLPTNCATGTY